MNDLNKNIKKFREGQGLSQNELAKMTGYTSRSSIAKIEKGEVDLPLSKIEIFADALGTTPLELIGDTWETIKAKTKWEHLINTRLTYEQAEVLRKALQLRCPVYFYGEGLGKSMIAEALKTAGYEAFECGEFMETTGQNYMEGLKVP